MRNLKKPCLCFIINLLEIAVLVSAADYGVPQSFGGSMTPVEISSQDINKKQAIPPQNILQTPSNFTPNSYNENENPQRNTREVFAENLASKTYSFNPQVDDNRIEENSGRNVREIFDTGSRDDTQLFDTGSMFDTDISYEGTCHKQNPVRNTREVFDTKNFDTGSIFDTKDSDTGSIFDTNVSSEDTKHDTCLRENINNRNSREVSMNPGPEIDVVNSNILKSIGDDCHEGNLKRNVRQVIGTSSLIDSNNFNQRIQESEHEIGLQEESVTLLNNLNQGDTLGSNKNIREVLVQKGCSEKGSKLTNSQDDIPLISNKLGIYPSIISEALLDGDQNFEEKSNRNVREVSNGQQNFNQNLKEVESKNRNARGVDDTSAFEGIVVQNLKDERSNENFDENNHRVVREVYDASPIETDSVENLKNIGENQDFNVNNHRNVRSLDDKNPMIGSDISSLDKLTKDGNLKEILTNPQNIITSDLIGDREGLKENVRNTREIIGDSEMNLETNLKKENQDSDNDEYLGYPSNYALNSDENLVEKSDRKAREIQGPSLLNSDKVLDQNMNENNQGNVENGQIVEGGVQRNVRDTQNPSLIDSDVFNQNLNRNDNENRERIEREASNESEEDEESDKREVREISNGSGILGSKFSRQNVENLDLDSENLEDSPGILDPALFSDDESLVGDNMRNIRDVSDRELVENESKMGGKYMNFETELREAQDGIQDMKPSLSNQENTDVHRNARDIPGLSREMNLELSKDEMMEEKRNTRDIPNSSRELDLEVSEGDHDIGNLRNVRHVSEGFVTNFPNVLSEQTGGNLRNIRETSAENSNLASNHLDHGVISDKSRNIREIPVENPTFIQSSLNQGSNFEEPLNIREIFFKNPGFNPDIFKQEPVIIGENRNIREISVEDTGFKSNATKVEPLVNGGDRVVNDVSVDSQGLKSDFTNKKVEKDDFEGEVDVKREARSCKKKASHHKNNTDEDFVYEKPPPLHASLQMMNVRIVKSKDDSKLLDDDIGNSGSTGEEKEGKRKKKKICRVKHLHVLQPLKKNSEIVEAPKKKLNILNSSPGETILKVLEATMDENDEGEGEEEEEEEGEKEGVKEVDKDNEEEEDRNVVNENKVKNKISRKLKVNLDRNNLQSLKDRGRWEGRIISSPLVAENLPKRVFGGTKKFVLSENRSQNYVPKSRKSLFKKERLKNDDPTFLAGVEVKKKLKNKMEDDGENEDDFDNGNSVSKVEEHLDEPCQSEVGNPGKFEILKLKDLQNFSEAINASDSRRKNSENKLYHFKKKFDNSYRNLDSLNDNNVGVKNSNNFDKNRDKLDKSMGKVTPDVLEDVEEEEEGEVEEEDEVEGESEEEDRGLKRREKDDESGEEENVGVEKVGVESDEFEENADMEEVNDIVNEEVNDEINDDSLSD